MWFDNESRKMTKCRSSLARIIDLKVIHSKYQETHTKYQEIHTKYQEIHTKYQEIHTKYPGMNNCQNTV